MPYRLHQIDPSKTVMIVVDMQNDFLRREPSFGRTRQRQWFRNLRLRSHYGGKRGTGSSIRPMYVIASFDRPVSCLPLRANR
jgi:hypothetical protein